MQLWRWILDCLGYLKMLEIPEPKDTFQGKLLTKSGTSPWNKKLLQSTKPKGVKDLKSSLASGMKIIWSLSSWFSVLLPHYHNVYVYTVPCCKYVICFSFWFYRGLYLSECMHMRDLELHNFKQVWDSYGDI